MNSTLLKHPRTLRVSNNDDLCEFQAGKSFDLPDPAKMRRRYANNWNSGSNVRGGMSAKATETVVAAYGRISRQQQQFRQQQQQQHSSSQHNLMEEFDSLDSCHGNVRYQAVEGMMQTVAGVNGIRGVDAGTREVCNC